MTDPKELIARAKTWDEQFRRPGPLRDELIAALEAALARENEKDAWIQQAKALLFDARYGLDNEGLKDEAQQLIDAGGGYDFRTESSKTALRWRTAKAKEGV